MGCGTWGVGLGNIKCNLAERKGLRTGSRGDAVEV